MDIYQNVCVCVRACVLDLLLHQCMTCLRHTLKNGNLNRMRLKKNTNKKSYNILFSYSSGYLAYSVLETLRVEYQCPGTPQACHREVIPVCLVNQAEFNTCFSLAGHSIQFPVTGDKCASRSVRTLEQKSQSRGWGKNPNIPCWEKPGVVLFIHSFGRH